MDIRQGPAKFGDIDPRALVVMTVVRHSPLLKPSAAIALDFADLVLARLIQKRAVAAAASHSSHAAHERGGVCWPYDSSG